MTGKLIDLGNKVECLIAKREPVCVALYQPAADLTMSDAGGPNYASNREAITAKISNFLHQANEIGSQLMIWSGEDKPANVLSSGQRAALAITIFWTMNLYGAYSPPLMLMDEPIQQVDDINSLNFLDTLRWIADGGKRQIIISTANSRIAGLIRRKFSYLEKDFSEILLERHLGLPVIKLRDHAGHVTDEQEVALHG